MKKLTETYNLQVCNPQLTVEWHPFKNSGLLPKDVYPNSNKKVWWKCVNGHEWYAAVGSRNKGAKCPYCAGNKKKTIEEIKKYTKDFNYVCKSEEYRGAHQKLVFVCPKNHKFFMCWSNFQQGQRCPYCAGNGKPVIETIRLDFEQNGCILKTTEYIGACYKLEYICPNGHDCSISWGNWKAGCRCPICAGKARKTIEFVRADFEVHGCFLLTMKYENAHRKLEYICSNGHRCSVTWHNWQQGQRCPICYKLNCFAENAPNWQGGISCEPYCDVWLDKDFKESIKQRDGYKCMNPDCCGTAKRLAIHHIDYVKKNCNPNNLITVCTSCNARANFDREWHKFWYQAIMYMRYGYTYK